MAAALWLANASFKNSKLGTAFRVGAVMILLGGIGSLTVGCRKQDEKPAITASATAEAPTETPPPSPSPSPSPSPTLPPTATRTPRPTETPPPEFMGKVITIPGGKGIMIYDENRKEMGELNVRAECKVLGVVEISGVKYVKIETSAGENKFVRHVLLSDIEDLLEPVAVAAADITPTSTAVPRKASPTPEGAVSPTSTTPGETTPTPGATTAVEPTQTLAATEKPTTVLRTDPYTGDRVHAKETYVSVRTVSRPWPVANFVSAGKEEDKFWEFAGYITEINAQEGYVVIATSEVNVVVYPNYLRHCRKYNREQTIEGVNPTYGPGGFYEAGDSVTFYLPVGDYVWALDAINAYKQGLISVLVMCGCEP